MLATQPLTSLFIALLSGVFQRCAAVTSDLSQELAPLLSPEAKVIGPGEYEFEAALLRWDSRARLNPNWVVEVATEEDIVQVIKYANEKDLPFLAVNGGHGSTEALTKFNGGIAIAMRKLNAIELGTDTATIQGGATVSDVITTLWNAGKQTVHGLADCTGFMGILMGGGQSVLQGRLGLAVDNLLEARVILADGAVVTASDIENSDLFWGIRGAGQNFGIVSKVNYRTYDTAVTDTWYYETSLFRPDQLEAVLDTLFDISDKQPPRLLIAGALLRLPAVDPYNALVLVNVIYDGPAADAEPYAQPFRDLKPIPFANGTVPYVNLASILGQGAQDVNCERKGARNRRFPVNVMEQKNPVAFRDVYNIYNTTTYDQPALNNSVVLLEGLAWNAVSKVPVDSTAVPVRERSIICFPVVTYTDTGLDDTATAFGEEVRSKLIEASGDPKHKTYVNYASGTETLEARYGYAPWRLERLRKLKTKYDPLNRFQWFNPVQEPASPEHPGDEGDSPDEC